MKRFGLTPLLILAAIAVAMLVAGKYTPYFPGDVPLAQAIQSAAPSVGWARAVTRAAYAPWIYGVLAVSALAAFRVAGWRAAVAMIVTMFALMHLEHDIKGLIQRPRPSPTLVRVAGTSATANTSMQANQPMQPMPGSSAAASTPSAAPARPSYSMPSGWALLIGSTVGLLGVLAWTNTRGITRGVYVFGCGLVLLAGVAARVALGAHWPSDVLAGYLLAMTIGLALVQMLATLTKGKGQRAKGRGKDREKGKG